MPLLQLVLSALLIATAVIANPVALDTPITPIAKLAISPLVQNSPGVHNVVQLDQARARYLNARGQSLARGPHFVGEPIFNAGNIYLAQVAVGTPPTTYNLIIDTGSSNTWVGANRTHTAFSKTSEMTPDFVAVEYGSGSFEGKEYVDRVQLGPDLAIQQSIGVALSSVGFDGVDGILGLGPTGLTVGTLTPDQNKAIPTVVDNAFAQTKVKSRELFAYFEPVQRNKQTTGELAFGGVDTSRLTGEVRYAHITRSAPASSYWGINQSTSYGSVELLKKGAGIVDAGTTLLLLKKGAYDKYQQETGAKVDTNTGLLTVSPSQYKAMKSLYLTIDDGYTMELTPNAQRWPRSLNSQIGGKENEIYLNVGSLDFEGLDFILGYVFLERFATVYDSDRGRVGFAQTKFTYSIINDL